MQAGRRHHVVVTRTGFADEPHGARFMIVVAQLPHLCLINHDHE
jgi:hypothetical protein